MGSVCSESAVVWRKKPRLSWPYAKRIMVVLLLVIALIKTIMFVFLENVFVYQHNLISRNNTPLLLPDIYIYPDDDFFCIHHVATIISTLNNNISKITISQLWPNMFKSIFQSQLFFACVFFILYIEEIFHTVFLVIKNSYV